MRRLADRLGIAVAEELWPRLVPAATFGEMRARADVTVPGASPGQWKDPTAFFRTGSSGQWRDLIDDPGQERYARAVESLVDADLSSWVHRPPLT